MSKALVSLHQVKKKIDQQLILDDICFSAYHGQIFTVIGPNGSGKTTLLRMINLLMEGTSGSLCFEFQSAPRTEILYGKENNRCGMISEKQKIMLMRQMHLIFQKPVVFSGTVLENCMICGALRGKKFSRKEAMEALERVGIASLHGQPARTLSGGEMTRLSLARAWLIKPELLLLDEPSANLDPKGIQCSEELMKDMKNQFGVSIMLVTQDLFQARRISDRIAFMLHGNIIEIQANPNFFDHPQSSEAKQFLAGQIVI